MNTASNARPRAGRFFWRDGKAATGAIRPPDRPVTAVTWNAGPCPHIPKTFRSPPDAYSLKRPALCRASFFAPVAREPKNFNRKVDLMNRTGLAIAASVLLSPAAAWAQDPVHFALPDVGTEIEWSGGLVAEVTEVEPEDRAYKMALSYPNNYRQVQNVVEGLQTNALWLYNDNGDLISENNTIFDRAALTGFWPLTLDAQITFTGTEFTDGGPMSAWEATLTVEAFETVLTPLGLVDAVRVRRIDELTAQANDDLPIDSVEAVIWYAPSVGMTVRAEVTHYDGDQVVQSISFVPESITLP